MPPQRKRAARRVHIPPVVDPMEGEDEQAEALEEQPARTGPRRNPWRRCRTTASSTSEGGVQSRRNSLREVRLVPLVENRPSLSSPHSSRDAASGVMREVSGLGASNTSQGVDRPSQPSHFRPPLLRGARRLAATPRTDLLTDPPNAHTRGSSSAPPRTPAQERPRKQPHTAPDKKPRTAPDKQPDSAPDKQPRATDHEPYIRCMICFDSLGTIQLSSRSLCSTMCGHVFCSSCIDTVMTMQRQCPVCKHRLTRRKYHVLFV